MEVYAKIVQKVEVDPKEVIEKLISKEIGSNGWISIEDGIPNQWYETSAGNHSFDKSEEISKEKYDYVDALQYVLKHMK